MTFCGGASQPTYDTQGVMKGCGEELATFFTENHKDVVVAVVVCPRCDRSKEWPSPRPC